MHLKIVKKVFNKPTIALPPEIYIKIGRGSWVKNPGYSGYSDAENQAVMYLEWYNKAVKIQELTTIYKA